MLVVVAALTTAAAATFGPADLEPYLATGPLAAARARFDAGLDADAYLLFHKAGALPREAEYLEGLAALQSDRPSEAAAILHDLAPRYPELADRIAYNEGLARERLSDAAGAAAAYAGVGDDSVLADDARLSLSRMLRQGKKLPEALAAVVPLTSRPPPKLGYGRDPGAEALFLSAEILDALGRRGDAAADYLLVWSAHPLSHAADDALERAEALKVKPELAARVARAEVILDANRNAEGTRIIEDLLPVLKLPDALACEARYALGRGYRKLRKHEKAIETLTPVARACRDPELRPRVLYTLGSSTSIAQPEHGAAVYEELAHDFPDHSYADDALFYEADLLQKGGDLEGARGVLKRLVEKYPQGDYQDDALFRLFWLDRRQGKLADGLTWLSRLEDEGTRNPGTGEAERAMYWSARTLQDLDRSIEALATFESLVRRHPTGYYAMLARGRLGEVDPNLVAEAEADLPVPVADAAPPVLDVSALVPDRHFLAAVELFRLGQVKSAADELWAIDRKAARERAGSLAPSLAVAYLLDRAGARQAAHAVAKTDLAPLLRGRPEAEAAIPFRIAYPQAYRDMVERWSRPAGVPPDLLQGIMREESSLDPDVVSWAGAVGLTQLMPSTARMVARSLKLGGVSAHQLHNPDLNVRLGAAYLGRLLKAWNGNPALAAASYNAGEGAVKRWLAQAGTEDIDAFVEEIPIEETRNYVRRVLSSFNAYRITYGAGDKKLADLALSGALAAPR